MQACVVEDDAAIRQTLRAILELEGYDVLEASEGSAALEIMRATEGPLVVLLDLLMPGMDGITLLQTVAADPELTESRAFIVVTAAPQMLTPPMTGLLNSMSIPIVVKPFDIDVLLDTVFRKAKALQVLG
jgi:CheY-like chemotaxis protein